MIDKLKEIANKLNYYGIPLPLIRDNKTGLGSVSLTLVFISNTVLLLGLIGKWSHILDIDVTQASYWFLTCCGLYFGRTFTKEGEKVKLEEKT